MSALCGGRIVIVTGAGRGLGRAHALELARQGARVVVNDLGVNLDGSGTSLGPAGAVVEEIRAAGGEALADSHDVSDFEGAQAMIDSAVSAFGGLDILVNNAGFLRDRMFVNMSPDEWDAVIRVHLRGAFAPSSCAATYWRREHKAGQPRVARVINTTSAAGLYGNIGQANYTAAKAGIAALTITMADELQRYGVTVNAIAPGASTRMTESLYRPMGAEETFDSHAPENVSPLVAWLASTDSSAVTGRVFNVGGGRINVAEGWRAGPGVDKQARWEPGELGQVIPELVAKAYPGSDLYGHERTIGAQS